VAALFQFWLRQVEIMRAVNRRDPLFQFMRKLHKWLGLIIGLQFLVWLLSGLVMSLLDQGIAGGGETRAAAEPAGPLLNYGPIVSLNSLQLPAGEVLGLRLAGDLEQPIYRVELVEGIVLFDARTGVEVEIDFQRARNIATASYSGKANTVGQHWLPEGTDALGGLPGPLWQVDFDDPLATQVFVDGRDGRVMGHYNDRGAVMEFLLMLHFMDYLQQGSFNNPQIIVVGFSALWLSISGLLLLLVSFNRRDVSWLTRGSRR
jgi:Na+-transporting NADH:ubiquinone oxidoreductase subunit F